MFLVDKTLISGVVFPYNVKNNRYEIFDIEKDKLADFFKMVFYNVKNLYLLYRVT